MDFRKELAILKKKKNAVILAHYYQKHEIQEIADYIEDSLGLAQRAEKTNADIIVFAGVHFMAETAKIINPGKKVLIPDINAGCSLADSCKYEDFVVFKQKYPEHKVISYINCSAMLKTISDVICTSGNAVNIVNSFPSKTPLIFGPDRNLGKYIQTITGRKMVLWDGFCHVHDRLRVEKVIAMKVELPEAKVIAHPECEKILLEIADFIGSTAKMLEFVRKDAAREYIVATETGILFKMRETMPDKTFTIVPADETCNCNDCEYMKLNTLEKLYICLRDEQPEITLDPWVIEKAGTPIRRMLELSSLLKK